MGHWRLWAPTLVCVACGGGEATPRAETPIAPAAAKPAPVAEAPDLSPVAAPAGLFVVGRVSRPTTLADTVARWAGLPVGLRQVLPLAGKELDAAIAWDAPIELAAALAANGHRAAHGAISLGLTGTDAAVTLARQQGYEVKRIAPETYLVGGVAPLSCAIAPALGPTSARLVCADRQSGLEDLLPYMARGLPTAALGQKDLSVELRVEPLRQRFASEIGSARLFAGFVVRELALDSPRFDRAVSDAVYAGADELVALVHDLDVVRLEGVLDEPKHEATLELGLTFRDHKSWVASVVADNTHLPGPAPESFFALPEDADEGGYAQGRDPHLIDGLRRSVLELADAYLEHEKIGKATRDRVARLIQAYAGLDGAYVHAEGLALIAKGARDKGAPAPRSGWMLMRSTAAPAVLKGSSADLAGVLSDKDFRAALARRMKTDDKSLPTARTVPIKGPGIWPGSVAAVVKVPTGIAQVLTGAIGWKGQNVDEEGPVEVAIAVVPNGPDALFAYAPNVKELTARLVQGLNPKGETLATRSELERMRHMNAMQAGFVTLSHLLGSSSFGRKLGNSDAALAALPHHGQAPIFFEWQTEPGAAPKGLIRTTVTGGVFEDLPGLVPLLATAVAAGGALR